MAHETTGLVAAASKRLGGMGVQDACSAANGGSVMIVFTYRAEVPRRKNTKSLAPFQCSTTFSPPLISHRIARLDK